jgi:hypothetical protein
MHRPLLVVLSLTTALQGCEAADTSASDTPRPDAATASRDAAPESPDAAPRKPDAASPPRTFSTSPSHASMFGQVAVTVSGDFSMLGTIESVTFDDIHALDLSATSSRITLRIQGAPAPGPARVVVTGKNGQIVDNASFTYDGTVGGAPAKWAAFGASLTQGFQSGGLQAHGQTMSWDAQIASGAGVFLGLPLVVDSFLPPIEPSAFVMNCNAMWSQASVAGPLIETVTDPTTHQIDMRRARQDATLATRNFAVGGATVADIIEPATGPISLIERVTELPAGDPMGLSAPPLSMSQVDRLVALDPDIAVSADLLANDSDGAVTASDDLHPEEMTPVATLAPELATLAKRLGGAHGQYFIGNLLPLDGLPNVTVLKQTTLASDLETEASFDAKLATIRDVINAYNQALASALAPYPNLHLVDLWTPTEAVLNRGLTVGQTTLTGLEFGGLLSLDFLHFTDTGYAFLANVFIPVINENAGTHIPVVDVASVLQNDALSPAKLAADGIHCPAL